MTTDREKKKYDNASPHLSQEIHSITQYFNSIYIAFMLEHTYTHKNTSICQKTNENF